MNIEEGQTVSKSEILAELDDKQASISYQLALAELSAKQAGFDEFTLLFKQQTQRFKRNQTLASKKLISEQLLEDSALEMHNSPSKYVINKPWLIQQCNELNWRSIS